MLTLTSPWLPFGAPAGPVRLYVLPHAGGAASAFRSWMGRRPEVAVCPVQPPGREGRVRESPHEQMETLVSELAEVILGDIDGPYAVYGHSLGALVGFELLREIRRRGGQRPEHLIISGCAAPQLCIDDGPPVAGMSDGQVVDLLRRLGGTPEWLLNDPAVLQMILPPFRADFAVKESYTYRPDSPFDLPVTALASTNDTRASVASMSGWRDLTTGRFVSHTLVGGHFAVLEKPSVTLEHIARALRHEP